MYSTTTQFWSDVASSSSTVAVTAETKLNMGCGVSEKCALRDLRIYDINLSDLVRQSGMLDDERRVVESAIAHLSIDVMDIYPPPNPTTPTGNLKQRSWELLLDHTWRGASVKGEWWADE